MIAFTSYNMALSTKHFWNTFAFILMVLIAVTQTFCGQVTTPDHKDSISFGSPANYQWNDPDSIFFLPGVLQEISGLSYYPRRNTILAVQDEVGTVFELTTQKMSILQRHSFRMAGDFEGICATDSIVYVTQADGLVYQLDASTFKLKQYSQTPFKLKNDVEALCSNGSGLLLFGLKGETYQNNKSDKRKGKSLVALNSELKFTSQIAITKKKLKKFLEGQFSNGVVPKGLLDRAEKFAPSGMDIHPETGRLYIVSARGQLLVILEEDELVGVHFLLPSMHPQPEGLCFDNSGNLYIANEGKPGSGRIVVYND